VQNVEGEHAEVHGIIAHSFGGAATMIALSEAMSVRAAVVIASPSDIARVIRFYIERIKLSARVAKAFRNQLETWASVKIDDISLMARLPAVKVPGLVVHALDDKEVGYANAQEIVSAWPAARLLSVEGAGHRRILKSTATIEASVEFLNSQRG
jgi:pimeloyl-ACP methyl ester carboxylesterase